MLETLTFSVLWRLAAVIVLGIGSVVLVRRALRFRRAKIEARAALIEPWTHSKLAATMRLVDAAEDTERDATLSSDLREVARRLRRFGIRARFAPAALLTARVSSVVCLAAVGWFLAPHLVAVSAFPFFPILLAGGLGTFGWSLPELLAQGAAKHRAAVIVEGLPDALELLVICAEGGLALGDGIDRIVKELDRSQPELAEELALTAADLKILPDQDEVLSRLAARIDAPIVQSVVTTLVQTMRYGTPFAQAIRVMAAEIRNDALLRLEERANGLPTLLTIPMILFILPTIILIVGGPAALKAMDMLSR